MLDFTDIQPERRTLETHNCRQVAFQWKGADPETLKYCWLSEPEKPWPNTDWRRMNTTSHTWGSNDLVDSVWYTNPVRYWLEATHAFLANDDRVRQLLTQECTQPRTSATVIAQRMRSMADGYAAWFAHEKAEQVAFEEEVADLRSLIKQHPDFQREMIDGHIMDFPIPSHLDWKRMPPLSSVPESIRPLLKKLRELVLYDRSHPTVLHKVQPFYYWDHERVTEAAVERCWAHGDGR